ncbi:MAG: SGNH/GDSL hydrolase family protein [Rhodothermia bacterium]|nr:SGNH/GDSL hydrolase family protein [Rhodothermia bacterium]
MSPELERQDQTTAQRGVQLGQALFTRMKAWADARDLPFWVCTTGWFDDTPNPSDANKAFWAVAPAFFRQLSVPFADSSRYIWLKRRSDPTDWEVPDGHPNPKGAELISKAVWPFVYSQLSAVSTGYQQYLMQGTENRSTRKLAPIP